VNVYNVWKNGNLHRGNSHRKKEGIVKNKIQGDRGISSGCTKSQINSAEVRKLYQFK
jgi:hypothetical protein